MRTVLNMALGQLIFQFLLVEYTTSHLHPNVGLGPVELATRYGFPLEIHTVMTEDGYNLTMHRIPQGKSNKDQGSRHPVLLMHGILSSSVQWLNMGESKALGFMLPEEGYDVWMGNVRGNTFSRKHITLDPDLNKTQFWDFSWHEMGYYDLPAFIDLILNNTGYETLHCVFYSQSTTMFFVMASTRPAYNTKITFAQLMAPVFDLSHIRSSVLDTLLYSVDNVYIKFRQIGAYEVLPRAKSYCELWFKFCDVNKPFEELCRLFYGNLVGGDKYYVEMDVIPVVLSNIPAGSSLKQFYHFAQSARTKRFRQFDHGTALNLQKYGSKEPPKYNLGLITTPVALYYGILDTLITEEDIERLSRELPNVVLVKQFNGNHDRFVWSTNLDTYINNDIIKNMAKYN